MKKYLILVFFLQLLLYACHQPEAQKEFTGAQQFRTTDPSRLYFNNIRSVYYLQEQQPDTRIEFYKLRRFPQTKERPFLYPIIANNWMESEAYIFLEKNDFKEGFSDTLTIQWKSETDSGYYYLPVANRENQYVLAGQLYESLRSRHRLFIKTKAAEFTPFFTDIDEQQQFKTVLRDYYQLTEVQ